MPPSITSKLIRLPPNLTNTLLLLLPLLLSSRYQQIRISPFTPRQLIYSKNDYLPFVLAPWAWPTHPGALISRTLIQSILIYRLLPATFTSVGWCYALWILIGLGRTLSGFLLTRSVGWAYPRLFNHYALYETIGGLGPALVAYLALNPGRTGTGTEWMSWYTSEDRGLVVVVLCVLLSWLDGAPWTYTMAMISVLMLALLRDIITRITRPSTSSPITRSSHHNHTHSHHHHPMDLKPLENPQQQNRLRTTLQITFFSLLLIPQPTFLSSILYPKPTRYPSMPHSPHTPSPLLEILILSHPRPADIDLFNSPYNPSSQNQKTSPAPSSILFTTISSYLPFLPSDDFRSPTTRLSIFTHTLPHPSFTHARAWLSPDSSPQHTNVPVEFYVDEDRHKGLREGQYLHLAEALRWAEGRASGSGKGRGDKGVAEWVLLVEDDFALCGKWGWEGIVRVMRELEKGRRVGVDGAADRLDRLGGFVGTGGSGLIIHRTLLPTLSLILRTHASLDSPLSSQTPLRPADLIIQDCLLGIDPLCPQPLSPHSHSPFNNPNPNTTPQEKIKTGGGPLVITSKLVMEHIGGQASTALGRMYEKGKWVCGWRHPFHGREEVDVVVV